jgi:8-oxo-dGTP pyrophosphatase MutT (NUDIX family)
MQLDDTWISRFSARLQSPLPGLAAQMEMMPEARRRAFNATSWRVPDDARRSAVLILFYPGAAGLSFPLIERSAYEGVHSKQIAFPGGATEPEDASPVHTALREAEEEVGINRHSVEVIGQLSPMYIPPSNFLVQPVVGVLREPPRWQLQPDEVASVIETPALPFLEGRYLTTSTIQHRSGEEMDVPSYVIQGHVVWGATAMMLAELSVLLSETRIQP